MTAELSVCAGRLREFISICVEECSATAGNPSTAERLHADAEFNGLALVLFALQFSSNAPYRKFCESRRVTPETVAHWSQIPAVPTAAFKELDLTCLPPEGRARVFHSSGTTEQCPSRHFHSAESLAVYEASLWPWFAIQVLGLNPARMAEGELAIRDWEPFFLTPPPSLVPHSSLVHMFEIVRQSLGAEGRSFLGNVAPDGGWVLDFDAILSRLADHGLQTANSRLLLAGTAFSFVHLLDFLKDRDLRLALPPGTRVMETGGYKGRSRSLPRAELHALITGRLGVPATHIICEYGMSELSSQAYDRVERRSPTRHADADEGQRVGSETGVPANVRVFRFPPWARAQVISAETGREVAAGETGLLRVFDLANVFSVMAIQTEDLAVRCADGFELLGRAQRAEPRGCSLMAG